ncbi:MAG: MerR family transcriptional regulator [Actinomycetota bacterium]|nr:MerR family transcriptional regulator [Actinomycetota bacterium]
MALPSSSSYFTIGQVLEKLRDEFPGVAVSKIRYWESIGLIKPMRAPSGFRKFCDGDIEDIRKILRTQRDLGVPLEVIRKRMGSKGILRSDQPLLGFEEDLVAVEDLISTDGNTIDAPSLDRRKYMRIVKDGDDFLDESATIPEVDLSSISTKVGRRTKAARAKSDSLASPEDGGKLDESPIEVQPTSFNHSDLSVTSKSQSDKVPHASGLSGYGSRFEEDAVGISDISDKAMMVSAAVLIDEANGTADVANGLPPFAEHAIGDDRDRDSPDDSQSGAEKSEDIDVSLTIVPKATSRAVALRKSNASLSARDFADQRQNNYASLPNDGTNHRTSAVSRRTNPSANRSVEHVEASSQASKQSHAVKVAAEVTRSARSKQAGASDDKSAERRRREPRGVLDSPAHELRIPADFLTVKDFARRCGASEQFVNECGEFGLVKVKKHQGVAIIAEHYLELVELARSLSIIGIAPRHLRSIKLSVSKDFSYITQLVTSPLASKNAKARRKAIEQAAILEQNFEKFRSIVMREMMNELFEGFEK